jgi:hypothetical protein
MSAQSSSSESIASLMNTNLLSVFNERSPETRKSAVESTYHPDIIFYDAEHSCRGHAELDRRVQIILDKSPGWVFRHDGTISVNHNPGVLAWQFGPPDGEPIVKGTDVAIVEDGKIKVLYVLFSDESKVGG